MIHQGQICQCRALRKSDNAVEWTFVLDELVNEVEGSLRCSIVMSLAQLRRPREPIVERPLVQVFDIRMRIRVYLAVQENKFGFSISGKLTSKRPKLGSEDLVVSFSLYNPSSEALPSLTSALVPAPWRQRYRTKGMSVSTGQGLGQMRLDKV